MTFNELHFSRNGAPAPQELSQKAINQARNLGFSSASLMMQTIISWSERTLAALWRALVAMTMVSSCCAGGGISTDGSVGAHVTISAGNAGPGAYIIPQLLGSLSGNNLFHSFSTFNVDEGQSVTFTTSASTIANIISRVTGGSPSQINGLLQLAPTSGSTPAFYFINPAGVIFGAGASVNVPGAYYVSTADYVKFDNGAKFYADLTKASTLSSAEPAAFGFLGTSSAAVSINGDGSTFLSPAVSSPIGIVAGDVTVDNAMIFSQGGEVRIVALGQQAQEVPLSGSLPVATGNLHFSNGGQIIALSNSSPSPVNISTGSLTLDGKGVFTGVYTQSSTNANAGDINVRASGPVLLSNGGGISSATNGQMNSGNIMVSSGSLTVSDQGVGTAISSDSYYSGSGSAGTITLISSGAISVSGAAALIDSSAQGFGNPGAISITSGDFTMDSGAKMNTGGFIWIAGDVNINSSGKVSILNGALINTSTQGSSSAGTINLNADSLIMDGASGIFAASYSGQGGTINIATGGPISISNGSAISTLTLYSGDAGPINIRGASLMIDDKNSGGTSIFSAATGESGRSGNIDVAMSGEIDLIGGAITSSTLTSGNAGTVTIHADSISMQGATSQISSETKGGTGNGGNISVTANHLNVASGYISSNAKSDASGNAGSVSVNVGQDLSLLQGGRISSSTSSPTGLAGTVVVGAGSLLIDGSQAGRYSNIGAQAISDSSGQTGNVAVTANDVSISNGGQISIANNASVTNPSVLAPTSINVTAPSITILNSPNAITTSSTGNVAAGSIKISASEKLYLDPSGITTTSNLGNGGAIDITAGMFWLDSSRIVTSVTGISGNGGNISIGANSLILNTGFIQANTAAANASGGTVSITAPNLISSGNTLFLGGATPYAYQPGVYGFNVIQAAAPTGVSGVVQISSPTLDVSGSLMGLNTRMVRNDQLAHSPCEITQGSSLAFVGRGGLPPTGADFLSPDQLVGLGIVAHQPSAAYSAPVRTIQQPFTFASCLATM